ncbi:MAG: hypothetical protein K2W85_00110 [Phycisphaerales bacterium]|nr:hypothetical protein [Phycisphaerales bacterium]
MLIGDITNSGALPSLEATLRFAGERQRLIAGNIANIDTPDYIQQDVSPAHFQRTLAKAVEQHRRVGNLGPITLDSEQLTSRPDGSLQLTPRSTSNNILFHDRNNRDVEQLMAAQAENAGVYRTAIDLIRSRFDVLRVAISERV